MARTSLAYLDHSKLDQSHIYALENVLEKALHEMYKAKAPKIIAKRESINPAYKGVFECLHSRVGLFCSWSKSERRNRFLSLLESFAPDYEVKYQLRIKRGDTGLPTPVELALFENLKWPDLNW